MTVYKRGQYRDNAGGLVPPAEHYLPTENGESVVRRPLTKEEVLERVGRALDEVKYGEITIKVQGGKAVWVDKFQRERVG